MNLRSTVAVCFLLALVPAAAAQKRSGAGDRGTILGIVKDEQGQPIEKATVHLFSRPIPARTDIGKPDRITVKSEVGGRFRASILRGRFYTVWAQVAGKGGRARMSKPLNGIVPGPPIAVQLGAEREPLRVRVTGREAWRAFEPLSFAVRWGADNVVLVPFELDDQHCAVIPPSPASTSIYVRAKDGRMLAHATRVAFVDGAHGREQIVQLSAPRHVRVLVKDPGGKPVAGARIWQNPMYTMGSGYRGMFRNWLGTTNRQGVARLVVPEWLVPATKSILPILAVEAGGGVARLVQESPRRGSAVAAKPTRLGLRLSRPVSVTGCVVDAAGAPVSGARVQPWNRPENVDRNLAELAMVAGKHVLTDDAGEFSVLVPFGDATFRIHASLFASDIGLRVAEQKVDVDSDRRSAPVRLILRKRKAR